MEVEVEVEVGLFGGTHVSPERCYADSKIRVMKTNGRRRRQQRHRAAYATLPAGRPGRREDASDPETNTIHVKRRIGPVPVPVPVPVRVPVSVPVPVSGSALRSGVQRQPHPTLATPARRHHHHPPPSQPPSPPPPPPSRRRRRHPAATQPPPSPPNRHPAAAIATQP
ncbi:unnamed protein product [Merluccius merluccius]